MAERQFATFRLGGNLFGINVLLVHEINRQIDVAPVELVPDFVYGLINLRGQIVTVLDIRKRLGVPISEQSPAGTIILKTNAGLALCQASLGTAERTAHDLVGFLVEEIGDMVSADDQQIEMPPAHVNGIEGRFLAGVIKLETELLVLLKIGEIIQIEK